MIDDRLGFQLVQGRSALEQQATSLGASCWPAAGPHIARPLDLGRLTGRNGNRQAAIYPEGDAIDPSRYLAPELL
jgi:hypothetical protein